MFEIQSSVFGKLNISLGSNVFHTGITLLLAALQTILTRNEEKIIQLRINKVSR